MTPSPAAAREPGAPREFETALLDARDECAHVKTFRLSVPEDFAFIPGQWVMLHFADEPHHARAYSISSSPFQRGHIEVSFNDVGPFTRRMFSLRPGATLRARGPYGKWIYTGQPNAVLVSGGTGITPFRAMGRYRMEAGLEGQLTILYSARSQAAMLYRGDLAAFQSAGIKVYATLTGPLAAGERWDGALGRLTPEIVARETPAFPHADFWFCGPKSFVSELTDGVLALGVAPERIHQEKWGDYKL